MHRIAVASQINVYEEVFKIFRTGAVKIMNPHH
jgi:hypothetical protein